MSRHQNSGKVFFSLKYKILSLLMIFCVLGLGIFLWISLSHFVSDKINYLLESSTQITLAETESLNRDVAGIIEYMQILGDGYNPETLNFSDQAQGFFARQKSILKAQLVEYRGPVSRTGFLLNKTSEELQLAKLPFSRASVPNKTLFFCDAEDPARFFIISRISEKAYQYIVAEVRLLLVTSLMERKSFQFAMLCPDNPSPFLPLSKKTPAFQFENEKSDLMTFKSFTREVKITGKEYLMSGSEVSGTSLRLVSFVDKSKAMEVIKRLQIQAVMVFLTILGLISIAALMSAAKLTAALEDLTAATKRLAVGDFNISLKIKTRDEVSVLAHSFVWMKDKIVELLEKTRQAARMEAEIETATLVQKTLFPISQYSSEYFEIMGEFKTASECGGDLWHYFETEKDLYLFIGDVVGHGLPSALMTTAARSVTALIKLQNVRSPAEMLRLLNHAIYETSKGKMWMTFFAARYEKATGRLVYSSASHNSPLLFPFGEKIKKADIGVLMGSVGPSLGRDESVVYTETEVQVNVGDAVFFCTDGVTECTNANNEMLGESKVVRDVLKAWNGSKTTETVVQTINHSIENFREGHPFEDDVTFFVLRRVQ